MSCWALTTVLALGAPALKEKPPDPPDGEWELVEMISPDGRPIRPKGGDDYIRFRFTATSRTAHNSQFPRPSTIRVAFSQVGGVMCMDLYETKDKQEVTARAIWKIEGDTLTICEGQSGSTRPNEFTSTRGSSQILMVLKRVKSE